MSSYKIKQLFIIHNSERFSISFTFPLNKYQRIKLSRRFNLIFFNFQYHFKESWGIFLVNQFYEGTREVREIVTDVIEFEKFLGSLRLYFQKDLTCLKQNAFNSSKTAFLKSIRETNPYYKQGLFSSSIVGLKTPRFPSLYHVWEELKIKINQSWPLYQTSFISSQPLPDIKSGPSGSTFTTQNHSITELLEAAQHLSRQNSETDSIEAEMELIRNTVIYLKEDSEEPFTTQRSTTIPMPSS